MSTPINPLTSPLAQIGTFQPLDEIAQPTSPLLPNPGDGSGSNTTASPISGNPVIAAGQALSAAATSGVAQTVSSSILTYLFTSRVVLFILGIICVIAGLYLLKPGPVTNVITAPIKAAKAAVKTGAEAAAAA